MTGATSAAIGLPSHSHSWRGLSLSAKLFITLMVTGGFATLIYGGVHQSSKNIAEFICYLVIAILPGWSRHRRRSGLAQSLFQLGNVTAAGACGLCHLSVVSSLSRQTGRRKTPCRGDGEPAPAHHRGSRLGH